MIDITGLRKVYPNGHEALKDINLTIDQGDLVCLLGPSGCGKTTILNLIAGLLDPTSGDIQFGGESVIHKHPKDRDIGLVFQNYALYPHMTVLENVTFPLRVGKHKKSKADAEKAAQEFMELTQITDIADKKPDQLSGGQQQRVAITRALVQKPKILLLDEPLSNLDARLRLQIREEIRRLVKKIGITTIFVTHDQEEAMSISDKIVLMNGGVVQQYDDAQVLYQQPENLFVASFIGNPAMNLLPVEYRDGQFTHDSIRFSQQVLDAERLNHLAPGSYILGVRPENVVLRDDGAICATIDLVERVGKECIIHFNSGGKDMRCVTPIANAVKEQSEQHFEFEFNHIFLFQEDGKRVY